MLKVFVALAAFVAIATGFVQIERAQSGLRVSQHRVGTIPVTVFAPKSADTAPVIVLAHGFAGSQQLMQALAVTLARNGYLAVTFDFPGHGRNPTPLAAGFSDPTLLSRELLSALDAVVHDALRQPQANGKVGLLGHSMASDIVVRYAQANSWVEATIAVSLFRSSASATSPRDLLIIDGALEPDMLRAEGFRVLAGTAKGHASDGVTYGDFANGSARRLALIDGVEHIGVLFSGQSMAEAVAWFNASFSHGGSGYIDQRGPWLLLLYAGLIGLAWSLAQLLPVVAKVPLGAGLAGRGLWTVAIVPALLTPLLLWKLPTDFLPILLGDYLVVHFALYACLTMVVARMVRSVAGRSRDAYVAGHRVNAAFFNSVNATRLVAGIVLISLYAMLVMGLPLNRFVTNLYPTPERLQLFGVMLAGLLPYFLVDEWFTRGAGAARGAYVLTKVCFLLSLVIAVSLNLERLFFLIIIVPVVLLLFVVYGLFSRWAYRATNHPWLAAVGNALTFSWFIAVSFPVMG